MKFLEIIEQKGRYGTQVSFNIVDESEKVKEEGYYYLKLEEK